MPQPDDMQMLTLYDRLFSELEQQAAEYAVWKNSQELSDALMGSGDIDLYVYPGSRAVFLTVLRRLRFVCLKSHKSFPSVEHYYGYDEISGKFAHLHCYFRMVTGESHIKQYVVPIEAYLTDYPAVMSAEGIRSLHPVLQKKLNIFRRKIKLSCLPGALLFFRERQGYRLEKELTTQALLAEDSSAVGQDAIKPSGWLADIQESPTVAHEILDGLRYRVRYQQWNRFMPLLTPLHRYRVIFKRLHGKLLKRKKTLATGVTLALSPADHTVSTTQIEAYVHQWMGKHISVCTVRIDRQKGAFANLMSCVSSVHDISSVTPSDKGLPDTAPELHQIIRLAWAARCWREQVRRSVRLCTTGFIVIWNPNDVAEIRRALRVVCETNVAMSRVGHYLLQSCVASMEIEPPSDARFRVTSACSNDLTASTEIAKELLAACVARNPFDPSALSGEGKSTGMTGESAEDRSCEGHRPVECSNLKLALWETVASLQY